MRNIYLGLVLMAGVMCAGKAYSQISVTATTGTTGPTTYTTLNSAINAINAGTHTGAISISVTGSTTETAMSSLNSSGTGAASYSSILIKPAAGVTANIASSTIGSGSALLKLNGADNVTIDGSNTLGGTTKNLSFINTGGASAEIWLATPNSGDGATNNVIKNCILTGASAATAGSCISSSSGVTLGAQALANNTNNTIQNNTLTGHQNGLFTFSSSGFPYDQNLTITGNTITTVAVRGMVVQGASDFTISNNTITSPGAGFNVTTANTVGMLIGYFLSNGNVFGNVITSPSNGSGSTFGTNAITLAGANTTSAVNVYNNFIINPAISGGSASIAEQNAYGIDISSGGGYNIYFNTISLNTNSTGAASAPIFVSSAIVTANTIDLRNNILVNTQTSGATVRTAIYSAAGSSVFSNIDYNDYYSTSGSLGFIGATNRTTLAQMMTFFGGNTNSINVNPTFVSTTNLDLQNVIANEPLQIGVTISSPNISTDIHGNVRSSNPVIGAHELRILPVITYSAPIPSCGNTDIVLSGVAINDFFGVPTSGALMPRIYFRKNSGAWFSAPGTLVSGSGTSGTWEFTISAATLGGLAPGNTVSYYVVAQNTKGSIVSNPSAGLVASNVNTVTTAPTTPNSFTVSAVPTVASFSPASSTTCVGTPVTFTAGSATGTGTLVSYNWTGPNSFAVTGTSPTTSFTPATTAASGQYTLSVTYPGAGCTSSIKTGNLTVNPAPPAITGTTDVCVGLSTTLHDATSGGIWFSSNTGVATVNISTGAVTGATPGTTTISYVIGSVCVVTTPFTVNPNPPAISGTPSVCQGLVTTLSDPTTGGTWISNNPAVASVNSTGDVTGVAVGMATITYTIPTGSCYTTRLVTVNANPTTITGVHTICTSNTTVLASTPAGGTWSSDNTTVATTSGSSTIIGVGVGTANITYTLPTGCINSTEVTVNLTPDPITGPTTVCSGDNITLSDATPGGNWTPNTSSIAYVNFTTGVVTGVASGVSLISYTMPTGCRVTYSVTGIVAPPAIGGTLSLCQGATTTLTNSSSGGTWISGNTSVATIGVGTGFVTAVSAGTTVITYTASSGCTKTAVLTVNILPGATTGPLNVCLGSTITLSNPTAGGTWISSSPSIASVGSTTGVVTGSFAGVATITYRLSTGCQTTNIVTVNSLPAAIGGTGILCQGATTLLTETTPSGTWTVSNMTGAATVTTTGTVGGVSPGTAIVSYTLSTGCYQFKVVTINPIPAAIGGTMAVCVGASGTLTDASPSGTWSSTSTNIAAMFSGSGTYTGTTAGNAIITYKFSTGCLVTAEVTINPLPSAISGSAGVCLGQTTTLSNSVAGGTWTSLNPGIASITSTGVVSGLALGTAVISYTLSTGCAKGIVVTVNALPGAITGTPVVCVGSTTNLSALPGGGTWTSADPTIATAGAIPGVIAGVSAGTVTISYNTSAGCVSSTIVTVHPVPSPITGSNNVCIGSTIALSTITTGGTWSSSNVAVGTVDASGNVTGIASGLITISYTLSTGCAATKQILVNPLPLPISGPTAVCLGSNITMVAGGTGTWSSSNVPVATIGVTSGIVTGAAVGTATISFIIPTGCYRTVQVTVNPTPAPIAGTLHVCTGTTSTLTDADAGGVWGSNVTAVAVVGATTGIVSGISAGTTNISYTLGTGCRATAIVTVITTPAPIGGTTSLCEGTLGALTETQAGGTWSSGNTTVADITTNTGVLSALTAGTATIVYTGASGFCNASVVVTVNPLPTSILGASEVCVGATTTFTDATPGGTWSSSASAIANAGVTTGVITGVSTGTSNITYKLSTGCFATAVITVDPLPTAINGVASVCVGNTTMLSILSTGGTWTSSNPSLANIDVFGTVTGIAPGTATITYTLPTGCFNTKVVTVNQLPSAIAGNLSVCAGQITGLYNSVIPGFWSSGNLSVATVGSTTGIVTGGSAGTADITYALTTGCRTTAVVTVNPIPAPITGTSNACVGSSSDLDNLTPGGTWSSSNNVIASVDGFGVVSALAAGTVTISYTLPTGSCYALRVFTVQALPSAFTGVPTVCTGLTTNLGIAPAGGAWSSDNTTVASVTGGVVSGLSAGTANIYYTLSTGCSRAITVTVNQTPPAITGTTTVCAGSTTLLTDAITGGTWVSNVPAVASVGYNTGIVGGNSVGAALITYTLLSGCKAFISVSVQATPGAIGGTAAVCQGGTSLLTNAMAGGTWSSSNTAIATIGSGSGILVGLTPGTVDISYTIITSGCQSVKVATVNALPSAITGNSELCVGATTTLSSATLGGVWSTSSPSVATVGASTGVVTGIASNTVTITYTMPSGCQVTKLLSVNPLPNPITGFATVCVGSTTALTDVTAGGVWSHSNSAIGIIDPVSGVLTGVSQGNEVITYTLPATGCQVTRAVTVYPLPSPITGTLSVCEGATTPLTDLTPGGNWGSSNTFVATVGLSTGVVSGASQGNATITYTVLASGCKTTAEVTVNPLPSAITGNTNICVGLSQTLTSLSGGGSWSSSNTLVASVGSSTGIVTGIAPGTSRITYLLPTGCKISAVVTVNALPAPILGVNNICEGSTTNLSDATTGGIWGSSNAGVASITSSGHVDAVAAGTTTISYTLATGCARLFNMTVNPTPPAITGTTTICRGTNTTLDNAMTGGIWTSSNVTVATISPSGGLLSGVNPGTAMITYSTVTGCKTFVQVSVSPVPAAIGGTTLLCNGSTVTLTDVTPGGTWSSDFDVVAIVDIATGVVTGHGPGITAISYTLPGGCSASINVTVNPAPPIITGDSSICVGEISHLSNSTLGGTWSTSDTSVATIGLGDGNLTGKAAGSSYVTYTLGAGCKTVGSITVNPAPAPIFGPGAVCQGQEITLTNSVSGGTWQSNDPSVASVVSGTGVVTGIVGGIDTIRYTLPGGCLAKFGITVNPTPPAIDNLPLTVCQGLTLPLSDIVGGGVWTSSNEAIAPIVPTPASNIVLGVAPGTVVISYTFAGSGCATFATLTVNPTPDAITGNQTLCEGSTSLLSSTSVGGSWSSSNPAVATIGSGTGLVTGVFHGVSTVTYTLPTGCITTALIVVNPNPAPINGSDSICVGSNITFTDATPFGTWSSSNTSLVTIGSGNGLVTGVAPGNATITYKLGSTGCYVTKQVTLNPLPPPVLGNPFLCVGSVTFLSNAAAPGGTWSSSNPAVGTVDGFGNVSGIEAGTTVVTYTVSTACYVSTTVTVEALPSPITGATNVCVNATTVLADIYFAGEWTSSNAAVATVGASSGVVTGVTAGSVTITYATPTAHCYVTTTLTVDPVPVAIVGTNHLCEGTTASYTDGTPGGTWSSSDVTIATIGSSTGSLSAIAPNTVTVSYTIANGCSATKIVTVDPLAHAGAITGPAAVCVNTTVTLSNTTATPAGIWSSSNDTFAIVDPVAGIVTGIAQGTAIITYISTNSCSSDTTTAGILVNPQPDAGTLTGVKSLCKDYSSTLSSSVPGGVWSSSDTTVATISATGVVYAVVPGTSTISYSYTNVCGTDVSTVVVTVNLVAPHTNIAIHPDTMLCMNTMYQNFGTDSAQPSNLIYTWTAVNAVVWATSPNKQNSVVNFPNPGLATVKLTTQIAATGCFVTDSFNVNVGTSDAHKPEVKYYNAELICTDNTADSYQWGYDDLETLDSNLLYGRGFEQQAYYLPVPDFSHKNYWVITRSNGCYQKTYYNAPTDVKTVASGDVEIKLFPNPADSRLNIEVGGLNVPDNITVRVVDMLGKDVHSADLVNGKGSINVSNFASGIYSIMFISDGTKIGARTFVKN